MGVPNFHFVWYTAPKKGYLGGRCRNEDPKCGNAENSPDFKCNINDVCVCKTPEFENLEDLKCRK